jgi:hypothetical protein
MSEQAQTTQIRDIEERKYRIFYHYNGTSHVYKDPNVVWYGLLGCGQRDPLPWEATYKRWADAIGAGVDPIEIYAATTNLATLARSAFELRPFGSDGTGMTDGEAISVLTDFLVWNHAANEWRERDDARVAAERAEARAAERADAFRVVEREPRSRVRKSTRSRSDG